MLPATRQPRDVCVRETRSILIVDDEEQVQRAVQEWLSRAGWGTVCAGSFSDALKLSKDPTLNLAFVDYRLDDSDCGIRLGRVLRLRNGLPFVLFSGYLTTNIVVEAMRGGALDVIDKPLNESRLIGLLTRLGDCKWTGPWPRLDRRSVPDSDEDGFNNDLRPAPVRWAKWVLKACYLREDPRRVPDWAIGIGTSHGTLDETCRLCGVTARDSRDLARCLRAVALSRSTGAPVWTHLAVADERTLANVLRRAGIDRVTRGLALREFLLKQTFVPTSKSCLRELAHLAANNPIFFDESKI